MKQLFIFIVLLLVSYDLSATNAKMFSYDHDYVQKVMVKVNKLDRYVSLNQLSFDQIDNDFYLGIDLNINEQESYGLATIPLGIPGVCWGGCLGIPGVIVVYLTTDEKYERHDAIKGCVILHIFLAGFFYMLTSF